MGSQDLQTLVIGTSGLAGLVGYYLGGVFTEAGYGKVAFLILTFLAILINISACFLDKKLEDSQ